ncbi:MAG: hypothetical protein ABW022_02280 [Actinoplanes sp.]
MARLDRLKDKQEQPPGTLPGGQIARTTLLIAVFDRYGGTAVALLLIAGTAPRLFGPALGALADRYDQRRCRPGSWSCARVAQRILATTAAIRHNRTTGQPQTRSQTTIDLGEDLFVWARSRSPGPGGPIWCSTRHSSPSGSARC